MSNGHDATPASSGADAADRPLPGGDEPIPLAARVSREWSPRRLFIGLAVGLSVALVVLSAWLVTLLSKPSGLVVRGGTARAGLAPVMVIEGPGAGAAPRFSRPMGAAFGLDGRIYVVDTGNNRVCAFDDKGAFLFEFGGFGVRKPLPGGHFTWAPGRLNYPIGIDVDRTDGSVYVADFRNDQIQKFTSEGAFVAAFPDPTKVAGRGGSGQDGRGIAVTDVAVSGGRVYATDTYQVFVFGSDGRLIEQFGKPGSGAADLDHPNGVTVGRDGTIYVSDSNHARLIAFDPKGKRLWSVGDPPASAEASGALGMPRGLSTLDDGSIVVADAFMFDLPVIGADGRMLSTFGERGDKPGQFNFPNDVSASGGLLLVTDKENNRVQVLRLVRGSQ